MPELTTASAAPLMRSSLTLQPNLFQLFQPIGGVRAKPLSRASSGEHSAAARDAPNTISRRRARHHDISIGISPILYRGRVRAGFEREENRRLRPPALRLSFIASGLNLQRIPRPPAEAQRLRPTALRFLRAGVDSPPGAPRLTAAAQW